MDNDKSSMDSGAVAPVQVVDVAVVGAGFAGLYALQKLAGKGLRLQCFEAGDDVGGTWYWNQYPGARCDVESLEYSYSFSDALQQDWVWSERYASQPEILRYIRHVADRFDLRRHIAFGRRVLSAIYDEAQALWNLTISDGSITRARYCVMASGNLSTPRVPDFEGLSTFKGSWLHSSRWPKEGVDLSGKRVAVIGTGSTGIQIISKVAEAAAELWVFQRSPNFCVPARNIPLDPQTDRRYKAVYPEKRENARQSIFGLASLPNPVESALGVSAEERERRYEDRWTYGGNQAFLTVFTDLLTNAEANATCVEFVHRKIRETVQDPATAELLCPRDHPIGSRRLCAGTAYYETYNRPNVKLVDVRSAPIERIVPKGIQTREATYEVDTIVFATGFDAMTGALREIDVRGTGGLPLTEKWIDGPTTYLGLMVSGFPNFFLVTGPGSPSVKSNMVFSIEHHIDWITDCIAYLDAHRFKSIEPSRRAESDWVAHVNEVADRTLYTKADSWYLGSNVPGKPRVFMPYVGGIPTYRKICADVAAEGYRGFELRPPIHGQAASQAAAASAA